jgi:prephenate dehydratase
MQVTEKKLAVSQEAVEALTFKILFKNIADGIYNHARFLSSIVF